MMEKPVRWAVVGLGNISRRMVKAIRAVEGSEVVACVSSSKERALIYGEKYGIKHRLTYGELAQNPDLVDAVYIATHMNAHAKPSILYLEKKLPVLCEKSFAVSVAEAESVIKAAKENDTLLMEAMWTRFLPATIKLTEILKSGKMGAVKSAHAKFEAGIGHGPNSRIFKKELGGGTILDLGVYPTTYTHLLLGVPEKVVARGRLKKGVDVNCETELIYPDGVRADFRVSAEFMTLKEYYIIECESGSIRVPSFFDGRKIIIKFNDGRKEVIRGFGRRGKPDGFTYEIRHFNDLVRKGIKESPVMTHQVTLEVMRLLEEQLKQVGVEY